MSRAGDKLKDLINSMKPQDEQSGETTEVVETPVVEETAQNVVVSTEDRSAYNCPTCSGEGLVNQQICPECGGTGKTSGASASVEGNWKPGTTVLTAEGQFIVDDNGNLVRPEV